MENGELTASISSIMISTMMFWYLMLTMVATVSLSGLMRVGPKTTPRLLAFIKFRSEWAAMLGSHDNHMIIKYVMYHRSVYITLNINHASCLILNIL